MLHFTMTDSLAAASSHVEIDPPVIFWLRLNLSKEKRIIDVETVREIKEKGLKRH